MAENTSRHMATEKNVLLHINEITLVVMLQTSLRLVEAVYKPQPVCVGRTKMTELCLESCMHIKRACLGEVPPGHPNSQVSVLVTL